MRENALKGEIQKCRDAFAQMENQLMLLGQRVGAYCEVFPQRKIFASSFFISWRKFLCKIDFLGVDGSVVQEKDDFWLDKSRLCCGQG